MLHNFSIEEYRGWYHKYHRSFIYRLDVLRQLHGKPIRFSKYKGALGRTGDSTSYHNYEKYGSVYAGDVIPEGINTVEDAEQFEQLARLCGFTGIGFYPFWAQGSGFHLDTRPVKDVATWGAYFDEEGEQQYIGLEDVYARFLQSYS